MIDSYGRQISYLRLSVTELCNLRCRYCMPEDGICKKRHDEMLTQEETISAIRAAASLGISKLRITGGEPLVKSNIVDLCAEAAAVDGIREVCGTLSDAVAGLDAALDCGFEHIKVNTVLIGGFNDDEIPVLAELTRRYPLDVRFIELMPMVDSSDFGPEAYLPCTAVTERLPGLEAMDPDGGVARLYRLPGAMGNIGLISPVSAHFCTACNRIRITADGKVKPCLHSSDEISIKGQDEEGMRETLRQAILAKPRWHGELSYCERSRAGRNMNQIGG